MQILSKTVQIFSVEDATAPFKFVTVELSNSGEHVIISQTNLINSPVIVLPPMWNWITTMFLDSFVLQLVSPAIVSVL